MRIASGLDLYEPERMLRAFVLEEYELYDGIPVDNDSVLRPEEIAVSVMVNSQISGNTARDIWKRRKPVEDALMGIDAATSICDDASAIPWDSMERAITGICNVHRAKVAVATKILHKKRPQLIPMLDSVIVAHYAIPSQAGRSWGGYAVAIARLFRDDLLSVQPEIDQLAISLATEGKPLTPCRILEILIWATLEPKGYYRKQ